MAEPKVPANLFGHLEPATHPTAGKTAPTGVPAPVAAAPAPDVAPAPSDDLFQTTMSNPSGQGETVQEVPRGNDPVGTVYPPPPETPEPDPYNAPASDPTIKGGMTVLGSGVGGALGVAGGPGGVIVGSIGGGAIGAGIYNAFDNIIHAVRGDKNEQGQPITFSQQSIDMIKNGFMSIGGTLGASQGDQLGAYLTARLARGPVSTAIKAGSRVLGGAVGTGVGSLMADLTADQGLALGKAWNLIPEDQRTPDLLDHLKDAVANGGLDLLINGALHLPVALHMGSRFLAQKFFGIDAEKIADAAIARDYGINHSINNMTDSKIASMYRSITSVIPFISNPYVDLHGKNVAAINRWAKSIPARISEDGAPVQDLATTAKSSVDTANDTFKAITDRHNDEFDAALVRADQAHVRFSTNSTTGIDLEGNPVPSLKVWANGVLDRAQQANTPQEVFDELGIKRIVKPDRGRTNSIVVDKDVLRFANKVANTPDWMTVRELDNLGKEGDALFKMKIEGKSPLLTATGPLKQVRDDIAAFHLSKQGAFTSSDAPGASFPAVGERILENARRYANDRAVFENKVGANILQSRDNAIDPETVGKALIKMESPDQVNYLRSVIGDRNMNNATAAFMESLVSESLSGTGTEQTFNLDKFTRDLSLNNKTSNQYRAIESALSTSDIKMADLEKFVKVAQQAGINPPLPRATMLARKLSFAGFASVMSSIFPLLGADLGHSPFGHNVGEIGTAVGVLLGWKGATIFSNPMYLRDATTALDYSVDLAARRMSLIRLAQAVLPNDLTPDKIARYGIGGGRTGKTPPPQYMKAVQDTYDTGSNFLRNLFQGQPTPQ